MKFVIFVSCRIVSVLFVSCNPKCFRFSIFLFNKVNRVVFVFRVSRVSLTPIRLVTIINDTIITPTSWGYT